MLKFTTKYVFSINQEKLIKKYQNKVNKIHQNIINRKSLGNQMMGWLNLPFNYDNDELDRMIKKSNEWKKMNIKNILIIGIGGSYIGIKAAIDMCMPSIKKQNFNFLYLANISPNSINNIIKLLNNSNWAIIVISKSGTTIEPAISFKIFRELLEKKYKNKASSRIVAITDESKGTLHDIAIKNKYEMFKIPNNIGGRYSTLTAVGMFPMILSGIDPFEVIKGAQDALKDNSNNDLKHNFAYLYACYRHFLFNKTKLKIENFIVYDPTLFFICEQYKQLFGESEGKNHHALYPSISLFTTDLHAMGQLLQEGSKNFFETTLIVKKQNNDIQLKITNNLDNLSFLNNWKLSDINNVALIGTIEAHTYDGKINNILIEIPEANGYWYGYLFTWLSIAAMMSGYLLNINPFDQPGVENYKKRMFKLLEK